MTNGPVYDIEAERAVLAHALLQPADIRPLTGELGLRPEHFYLTGHQAIWHAMIDLHDAGDGIDQVAISRRVGPDAARAIADIIGLYYAVEAYRDHAKRILTCHRYERVRRAGVQLAQAAGSMNDEQLADAERQLTEPDGHQGATLTGEQRKDRALDRLYETERPTIPTPWRHINTLIGGGTWPGRYILVGGYGKHGKSCAADQLLEHAADRGKKAAVYLTEMNEDERTDRSIARHGTLTMDQVQARHPQHHKTYADTVKALPDVACIEAHDWTVSEITRHITHHGWDVCAVDGMHDIPYTATSENLGLSEIGRSLLQCAKRTRTAIFNVVHLNDNRVTDHPPPPVNRDIRGSGMLYRQADAVLMVWQEEDDDGPTGDGLIRVTACRQGRTGTMRAHFRGDKQRWDATDADGLRAVA
jgi:replicative DNA helicase